MNEFDAGRVAVVDPEARRRRVLDALVETHVLSRFGHTLLKADPAFGERVPTAENIAAQEPDGSTR